MRGVGRGFIKPKRKQRSSNAGEAARPRHCRVRRMKTIPRPILCSRSLVNRSTGCWFIIRGEFIIYTGGPPPFPPPGDPMGGVGYKRENLARDKFPEINWIQPPPPPSVNGQYYGRPDK